MKHRREKTLHEKNVIYDHPPVLLRGKIPEYAKVGNRSDNVSGIDFCQPFKVERSYVFCAFKVVVLIDVSHYKSGKDKKSGHKDSAVPEKPIKNFDARLPVKMNIAVEDEDNERRDKSENCQAR
jgi:hypothetical protein